MLHIGPIIKVLDNPIVPLHVLIRYVHFGYTFLGKDLMYWLINPIW